MFQPTDTEDWAVATASSQISYEGKRFLSCWVLQEGIAKDEECMCYDCLKGSSSLSCLVIATFSFVISYVFVFISKLRFSSLGHR